MPVDRWRCIRHRRMCHCERSEAISSEGAENMTVVTNEITFQSKGNGDVIDITSQVARIVEESGVNNGIVNLFVVGSTAGITTVEYEPNLLSDFKNIV